MEKGHEFWKKGMKTKAMECYQSSVDVSPFMAYQVIKELRKLKIPYVVAPYEADSQIAYLDAHDHIQAVLTEDSDLLVFGCRVALFKMTPAGAVSEIRREDLGKMKEFESWDFCKFRQMCILSGCDYLPSPVGVGLKKAMKHLKSMDAPALIQYWAKWGASVKAPPLVEGYLEGG